MLVEDNRKEYANFQSPSRQMVIPGLEVPQAAKTNKHLRKTKKLPLTESPLFTNKNDEMTATSAPIISATQAYLKHPDWSEYDNGSLYFQKPFGKGRYIEFYILHKQEHQPQYICNSAEHKILEQYGVMAARLHAVFATYAALQAQPWKQPFVLQGSELIKILKVYKSKKLTKSQKLKAIADLAVVVGTLGAVIHWYEGELNLCIKERCLLWIVSVQEYSQPNLFADSDELYEVIIRVQPGLWTYNFLNYQGEQSRTALYQYGFIPKQVFDIDPHRHKLASSLALYIIQNSRAHKSGIYTINSLLSNVMPSSDIEQALSDYRYGARLKETLEEALLILKDKVGIKIEFDDRTYPIWLRPSWAMPDELSNLPTKQRNQQLLGTKRLPDNYIQNSLFPAKLIFKLPPEIQRNLNKFKTSKTNPPKKNSQCQTKNHPSSTSASTNELVETPPQASTTPQIIELPQTSKLTGDIVRQARTAMHMNQRQLAQAIGMSQSWVRDIETEGRDKPVPEKYAVKLTEVLNMASCKI
ncbi:helix-turn-helix domain-containing protein [Iningainema tapete]|uniref:Helix-turn-helix transcriptional regulator n=1 Tax=Iningainema tapete BLCC-T55 TaxID=2748662 RepID=A0A8J7C540_9CYAN|nr:helix-turn-helix transcriptional regulator [Iningainema tapete]MBD2772514.1 helix-turn-helix transcriptional regulator [Iningainema tapete BLCC-T55]